MIYRKKRRKKDIKKEKINKGRKKDRSVRRER
jgi:hypothetical protein